MALKRRRLDVALFYFFYFTMKKVTNPTHAVQFKEGFLSQTEAKVSGRMFSMYP